MAGTLNPEIFRLAGIVSARDPRGRGTDPWRANPSWYLTCMHGEEVWGCHVCFYPAGFLSLLQFLWEIVHNEKKQRVGRQMVATIFLAHIDHIKREILDEMK